MAKSDADILFVKSIQPGSCKYFCEKSKTNTPPAMDKTYGIALKKKRSIFISMIINKCA